MQCLQNPETPLVTSDLELTYVKEGSAWRLEDSAALTAALLGGLDAVSAGDTSDALLQATAGRGRRQPGGVAAAGGDPR